MTEPSRTLKEPPLPFRGGAGWKNSCRSRKKPRSARPYKDTIAAFDRTPPGIVCPHFVELRWAFGCPYGCQWCYLMGTSFGKKHFRAYDLKNTLRHLRRSFLEREEPTLYNSGELSDSMPDHPHMKEILRAFASPENRAGHRLLIVTKSGPPLLLTQWLLCGRSEARRARKALVYSCSLNAPSAARMWEKGAPPTGARIEGLSLMSSLGVETRARIDPIVPFGGDCGASGAGGCGGWKEEYSELARAASGAGVGRITLGTLRGLTRTLVFAKKLGCDTSWTRYLKERTAWGMKMAREERVEAYAHVIDCLRAYGFRGEIGICKEEEGVVRELIGSPAGMKCNCSW